MSARSDDRGPSARFDAEELLRHATWLRALARALVRPDDVDDVVQETWAAALAHPPGSAAALRAWLERVVRNVAFQFSRSSVRRARREQAAALRESQPSTADVVARAALHRELVGRVLALDEPARTVVLLRFFDGLRAAQIAVRVGASEEAVRQRLKRGLDRIRVQLDAEHGGRREEWLGAFAALGGVKDVAGTVIAAAGGKGVVVGAQAKFAIAAAAILAGAGWLLMERARSRGPGPGVAAAGREAGHETAEAPQEVANAGGAPDATSTSAIDAARRNVEAPAPAPVRFVYGALVDSEGAEMKGAELTISRLSNLEATDPASAPQRDPSWSLKCSRGCFALAGLLPGRFEAKATATGYKPIARTITIEESGEGTRLDLVFERQLTLPIRLLAPDGRRLVDAVAPDDPDVPLQFVAVVALPEAPPSRLPLTSSCNFQGESLARWHSPVGGRFMLAGEDGPPLAKDVDGVLLLERSRPFHAVVCWRHVVLASRFIADPDATKGALELTVDPTLITASLATLKIRCTFGSDGRPAPNMVVQLEDDQGWFRASGKADADGIATVKRVAPGLLRARIGGRSDYLRVDAGGTTEVGPIDVAGVRDVAGQVVDEGSRPIATSLEWCTLDLWRRGRPLRFDFAGKSEADGRVALYGATAVRHLVRLAGSECAANPVAIDPAPGASPIRFVARTGTPVSFDLPDGFPLLPTIFEISAADGSLIESAWGLGTERLLPGRYRLTVLRDEIELAAANFEVGAEPTRVKVPAFPGPFHDAGGDAPVGREAATLPVSIDPAADLVGIVVFGRIGDGEGVRFNDGFVTARGADHSESGSPIHDGCFAVAGMRTGGVEMFARGKTLSGFRDWIEVAATPKLLRHDFVASKVRRVDVELVDAKTGAPLGTVPKEAIGRGAALAFDVVVTREPATPAVGDDRLDIASIRQAATFRWTSPTDLTGIAPRSGFFEFDGALPIDVSLLCGGRVLHQQRIEAPVAKVVIPVDWESVCAAFATLRVRIVDAATGAPLAPTAFYVTMVGSVYAMPRDDSKRVDDAGTREIGGLAPTDCKLVVETPGHERIEHRIALRAGLNDLGTLALATPRTLAGRVVDDRGAPIRCSLRIRDVERANLPVALAFAARAFTDEDGRFSLPIGAGAHEVGIQDERFAATTVVVSAGSAAPADIEIVLRAGTPVAIRDDALADSIGSIVVEDARGGLVARGRAGGFAFRLRLAPGRYLARALAREGAAELGATPFEVRDAPVEVVLGR
jgi:RNA polymerase sigma-70 factor (ECF subfamily)